MRQPRVGDKLKNFRTTT